MKQLKYLVLSVFGLTFFVSCTKYIHTRDSNYQVSVREYRLTKQNERIYRKIERKLGIKTASDSLSKIYLASKNSGPEIEAAIYDQLQTVSSAYRECYVDKDTIGASRLFKTVFPRRLEDAIANYSLFLKQNSFGQIWITFFEKDEKEYFYLMQGPVMPVDADGYALYDNRIHISLYDHLSNAKRILNVKKMRKYPYFRYREIGEYTEGNYDGPVDVYQIIGRDSITRVGRVYMDAKHNFIPYQE